VLLKNEDCPVFAIVKTEPGAVFPVCVLKTKALPVVLVEPPLMTKVMLSDVSVEGVVWLILVPPV